MFLLLLSILETLFSTLSQQVFQSDFVLSVTQELAQPRNMSGSVIMKGEQFSASMSGIEAAYDGKTLYMYQSDIDELTLSNPTAEELTEVNPLAFAQALVATANITEHDSRDGKSVYVTLTPKNQEAGIKRFVVKINREKLLPLSVEMHEGKQTTTLTFKNPQYTNITPSFVLEKDGAYINDLR